MRKNTLDKFFDTKPNIYMFLEDKKVDLDICEEAQAFVTDKWIDAINYIKSKRLIEFPDKKDFLKTSNKLSKKMSDIYFIISEIEDYLSEVDDCKI